MRASSCAWAPVVSFSGFPQAFCWTMQLDSFELRWSDLPCTLKPTDHVSHVPPCNTGTSRAYSETCVSMLGRGKLWLLAASASASAALALAARANLIVACLDCRVGGCHSHGWTPHACIPDAGDGTFVDSKIWGIATDKTPVSTSMLYSPLSMLAFLPTQVWPGPDAQIDWQHVTIEVSDARSLTSYGFVDWPEPGRNACGSQGCGSQAPLQLTGTPPDRQSQA